MAGTASTAAEIACCVSCRIVSDVASLAPLASAFLMRAINGSFASSDSGVLPSAARPFAVSRTCKISHPQDMCLCA